MKLINLKGLKFGYLSVVKRAPRTRRSTLWECVCWCGNPHVVSASNLSSGNTRSCGCMGSKLKAVANTRHGCCHPRTREYSTWKSMRGRCLTKSNPQYNDYGGRGIKICERWNLFESFLADMGKCPLGMSIDRINNDGNYEPSNCRWATQKTQSLNTRANKRITFEGESLTHSQWADRLGFSRSLISQRINAGWTEEKALTKSAKPKQ